MFTVPMSETGEGMWAELEGRKKEETSRIVRSGYGITRDRTYETSKVVTSAAADAGAFS